MTGSVPFVHQRIDRSVWVPNFLDTGDGENFFGPVITAWPAVQDLRVANHDAASATPVRLDLTIRGGTLDIEHRIRVEINGNQVGTAVVLNRDVRAFKWDIPHAWLVAGSNTLTLTALNGDLDVSVLVSARLTYQHLLRADDGMFEAELPAEGMNTVVVDVDDIYDEYNFGVRSPTSIRSFLKDTQTWNKAPTHVLLVGDASMDPRGYLELGLVDYMPTQLVPTVYLKTASDGWFVDFKGTGVEDLAIGRLPVRTAEQAALVVGKLGRQGGHDRRRPRDLELRGQRRRAEGVTPTAIASSATTINIASTPSPRDAVLAAMNDGSLFVDYVGHGSVSLWNHNVLTDADGAALTNGNRLPFVAAMTCLNAYFHDLFTLSLAEALLTAPNGGAIAVWSSSTLTEPGPQLVMNQELLRHIFKSSTTIGQAILKAKLATPDQDVRRSWNLLGDPSMKLTK